MRLLGRILFIAPLSLHIGYFAATYPELFSTLGAAADRAGMPRSDFALFWSLTVGLFNLVFMGLEIRMPRMKDSLLRVPNQTYWLETRERRLFLVSRLRGIVHTALFGLNVFFLAVYQSIYQANALAPAVRFELPTLITFFMFAPLLGVAISAVLTVRGFTVDAAGNRG